MIYTILRILNSILFTQNKRKIKNARNRHEKAILVAKFITQQQNTRKNVEWSLRIILTLIAGFYETSNKRNSTDYDHRELSFRTKITLNCIYLPFKLMKETEIYSISCSVAARCLLFLTFNRNFFLSP